MFIALVRRNDFRPNFHGEDDREWFDYPSDSLEELRQAIAAKPGIAPVEVFELRSLAPVVSDHGVIVPGISQTA